MQENLQKIEQAQKLMHEVAEDLKDKDYELGVFIMEKISRNMNILSYRIFHLYK